LKDIKEWENKKAVGKFADEKAKSPSKTPRFIVKKKAEPIPKNNPNLLSL
jgi:hypothetical protein